MRPAFEPLRAFLTASKRAPSSPARAFSRPRVAFLAAVGLVLATRAANAATDPHGVDLLPVLEGLVLMILGGKLGGAAFSAIKQSPVLGELTAGVLLGNLGLVGFHGLDSLKTLA